MTLGPLEYVVVGFEGNRFTGKILAELRAAKEKGIIRIIDLLLIMKDENGNITARLRRHSVPSPLTCSRCSSQMMSKR